MTKIIEVGTDLAKAKELLVADSYTCVAVKSEDILTSTQRGVKPLLEWFGQGLNLSGYSVADKVVGKGAALLYVLLGIEKLYAGVLSREAYTALSQNGIEVYTDNLVDRIRNRTNTGYCPIEEAVLDIAEPEKALQVIKDRLAQLSAFNN